MTYFTRASFTKSVDSELDRLDALLARQETRIQQAFAEFVREAKSEAVVRQAADLLAQGDPEAALKVVDSYIARMASVIPTVYQQAGAAEVPGLAVQLAPIVPAVAISFDPTDTRTAMVMREATLQFISAFTDQQRTATRQALADAFQTGQGTQGMARAFRDSIGLAPTQEQAVRNYRRLLEQGSRDALDRANRDRRHDRSVERVVRGGAPLTPQQIDTMVERYRGNTLIMRSEVIARTEAVRAVGQARQLALEQNLATAGVSRQAVTQTWRAVGDHRTRDTHKALNGQTAGLGQGFVSPSGAVLRYPGDPLAPAAEVINCRCHLTSKIDPEALRTPI